MTISTKDDKTITTSEVHFHFVALNFAGILEYFNNTLYGCYSTIFFTLKMESATRNTFWLKKNSEGFKKYFFSSALFIIIFKPKMVISDTDCILKIKMMVVLQPYCVF